MPFFVLRKYHVQAYRNYKLKTTRSKQPVLQSPREPLQAPTRADNHKGSIVQTSKGFELKKVPMNHTSIHVQFNSVRNNCSLWYVTVREVHKIVPLYLIINHYVRRDHNTGLPKNVTQGSNIFLMWLLRLGMNLLLFTVFMLLFSVK